MSGIAGDGKGGFVVTEADAAPRRTAHFDAQGALLREWYGGQEFGCTAAPDPANPNYLWFDTQAGWVVQAEVDYRHGAWHPYAAYRYDNLANGMTLGKQQAPGGWQVRHHGKLTYLLRVQGYPCLLRVDDKTDCLVPEMWINREGNAQPAATESVPEVGWEVDDGFTFVNAMRTGMAKGYELRTLTPLWQKSAPHYPSFDAAGIQRLPADASKLDPARLPVPIDACREAEGNCCLILRGSGDGYAAPAAYPPPDGYRWPVNGSDTAAVVQWDAHGNVLWRAGLHAARPDAPRGLLYAPVRFAGRMNGCIGVCDRIAHPCEFWTDDGLYAGGLFDRRAPDGRPARDYAWWRVLPAGNAAADWRFCRMICLPAVASSRARTARCCFSAPGGTTAPFTV